MIFLLPLIIPAILGTLTALLLLPVRRNSRYYLLVVSLALPAGLGICSSILFWSHVLYAPAARGLSLFLSTLLIAILLFLVRKQRNDQSDKRSDAHPSPSRFEGILTIIATLILAAVLYRYTEYFLSKVAWNVYGGWDARFFWGLKSKFLFRDPEKWTGMFDPMNSGWAHPDYPLLVPGAVAWGWNTLGKEALFWPPVVDLVFFLGLCALAGTFIAVRTGPAAGILTAAFLAGTEVFRFWSTTQYADIPLSFFFTASVILFYLAHRSGDSSLYFFSGLFAGFSAWTKNEGLFFVVWLTGIFLFTQIFRRSVPFSRRRSYCLSYFAGLFIMLAAVIYLKMFLGTSGAEYLGSGRSISKYLTMLFGDFSRTRYILAAFFAIAFINPQWAGLWILFALALIFGVRKSICRGTWVFPLIVLLIQAGYIAVMHVTPYDLKLQIETAMLRLLLQSAPLAVIFVFDTFAGAEEEAAT